jgi:hypothetical protein
MSEAIDFRLTQHKLDMSSLKRVGQEVDRLYLNNLNNSDIQMSHLGIKPKTSKSKLYSVKDEANLMSYVSNRVQKAKNEVTTNLSDLKRLEKYKKQSYDITESRISDIHLGMKRRM